jgi:glucosylglycerate phosphorylase
MMDIQKRIREKLTFLYGADRTPEIFAKLRQLADLDHQPPEMAQLPVSEKDVILITYGNQVQSDGQPPLAAQHRFLQQRAASIINTVHILPFFPYSSDDGFSVIDYTAVNPDFGNWEHIQAMGKDFRLMFDVVVNHVSAKSAWFQRFLNWQSPYNDYFIVVDPSADLSKVVRPRALPLLTPFTTPDGVKQVWTTFSEDQIDLNFSNPDVLLEIIKVLLFYVEQGARLIRLDAIAFLWKEIGTDCMHRPQTHTAVQLMRDVLDLVAPDVVIITETNVPHDENISYFGDGSNEAQLVYQFPLPPLILYTMAHGNADDLAQWAASLDAPGNRTTFFNFMASHDGIGLRPLAGIVDDAEIDWLAERTQQHGGHVSYRNMPDGSQKPYELNISFFDAITHPDITEQAPDVAVKRFIVSQAIGLSLAGVPGIYFHSLFGSRNDYAGVAQTGRNRSINRETLQVAQLEKALDDPGTIRAAVFHAYQKLLQLRTQEAAFHPLGRQIVHQLNPALFVVERLSVDEKERVFALQNVTGETVRVTLPIEGQWHELVAGTMIHQPTIELQAYQVAWLKQLE